METAESRRGFHASPKRKRGEFAPGVFIPGVSPSPAVETSPSKYLFTEASVSNDGSEGDGSPRSKIASRLQRIHLDHESLWQERDQTGHVPKRLARMSSEDGIAFNSDRQCSRPQELHFKDLGSASSSRTASETSIQERPLRYSRSPPLEGEINDNFWHDNEITGHQLTDPADDGYGLNGLGFMPTAAMAWSRSQRRKQQIADYRSREAREARLRRNERRNRSTSTVQVQEPGAVVEVGRARVHFEND